MRIRNIRAIIRAPQEHGHRGPDVEAVGLENPYHIGQVVIIPAISTGQLRVLLFPSSKSFCLDRSPQWSVKICCPNLTRY